MRFPKRLRGFPILFTLLVSALVLACTTQPTDTAVPPTATTGPAATEPATDTPVPPTATAEPAATAEPTATTAPPTPMPTEPSPEGVTVGVTSHPDLGSILTDADGNTLYLFTRDESNVSNCAGGCASNWPPLVAEGDPSAGDGVAPDLLSTISREDGSSQVAYNGWPLYYYTPDENPGDATGQDAGGVWFVVSPYGGPIQTNAVVGTAQHPELGTILADASGRTLYLFTRDDPDTSNCADGCARNWPPLLTTGEPAAAGDDVVEILLGTTARDDGSTQVTYNGLPLYYYAADESPGDATGQNAGEVWFVVSPAGEGITMAPAPDPADTITEADPTDVLSVVLHEDNDSGQTGWATLIARGDQTEAILNLPPGDLETEAVHIHSGQCGPDLGGVVHPLTSFEGGSGLSVTTVEVELASLRNGDFAINTHQSGNASVYTSCANIPTPAQAATIALNEDNASGQSGVATLTARGAQTDAVLHLSSGDLETELVHIHSGQCGPDLGGVVHPLTSFVDGAGASVTTIDASLNSVQTGDFAINTHQAGNASTYTSCGNIARNFDTITVPLEEQNDSGQTGAALLTPRGDDTEVWLTLSEGDMESSAVHIHTGQCGPDLGGVEHPLTNIEGGASATLVEGVTLDSLLTGGFAINSHNAQNSSIYTACGNIPGTDVSITAADFDFDVGELEVEAGQTITLNLTNQGERPHNIFFSSYDELNADNERGDRLSPGQTRTRQFTFDRPGLYPFYCPVGNGSHRNRGQIGVLRVVGDSEGDPTVTLSAPSPSTVRELEGPQILYGASVNNFNISGDEQGSGLVKVSLDGEDLGSSASIVGALDNVSVGEHTVTAELLNSDETPLDPPVQSSLTFTVEAGDTMATGSPMLGPSPIADRRTVRIE